MDVIFLFNNFNIFFSNNKIIDELPYCRFVHFLFLNAIIVFFQNEKINTMNNFLPYLKSTLMGCMLCLSFVAKAQNPTYELHITNETQPNDSTYQFDVYLLRTGATPFELASFQFGIGYDTSITNGGKILFKIVSNSSQLVGAQAPISVSAGTASSISGGVVYKYLNLAARSGPGSGNGTVISEVKTACTAPGTRVGTFQVLDSGAKFRSGSSAKLIFSTASGSGKNNTIVNAYVNNINTTITNTASNLGYGGTGTCYQNIAINTCNLTVTKTSQTNVTCFGASNGTSTVTLSGGYGLASTGTYKLDNPNRTDSVVFSSNPFTVSGLSSGSHTIYVRSSAGSCTANTGSFTITAPLAKDSASYPVSGCGSYSLPWGGTVTTVGTTNHSHTYSSVNSCDSIVTYIVTVSTPPVSGELSGTQAVCSNGTTTFSSTVSGGSWTSGSTGVATINSSTGVITPVSAGTSTITYTVTGTGGCSNATATRTVTVTAAPNSGTLSGTQAICSNGSSTFSSTSAGGVWSSSDTTVARINSSNGSITPVSAGTSTMTYTVTGTGSCSNATATRTVIVTAAPNSGTLSGTQAICSNGSTTFSTTGSGGTWTSGSTGVATINSSTGVITPVSAGTSTITYTVIGTGGCSNATATRTVTITAAANSGTLSGTQALCSSNTTTYSSTVAGGTWTSSDQSVVTINPSTGAISPVSTGSAVITYTVTGTGGCSNVSATRAISISSTTTYSTTVKSACGVFSWNGSNYTSSGTYYKTLTNAGGCDSIARLDLTFSGSAPTAPSTLTQTLVDNTCGARVYRYTVTAVPNVLGYAWSLPQSVGGISGVTLDSGDIENSRVIRVIYSSNAAALTSDSIRVRTWSACGNSIWKYYKLTNTALSLPSAPASITVTPISINNCSAKIYQYAAPNLITSAANTVPATGWTWSFTGSLGANAEIIDTGSNNQVIQVRFSDNGASATGDSVRVAYTSDCGTGKIKALKLTNANTKLPSAPASITAASVLTNVCSGKIYRYTAPALPTASAATATVASVSARLWSFTGLGLTGSITTGDSSSTVIQVTYPTNDAAATGDSVKLQYVTSCGYTLAKAIKLTNAVTKLPTAPASVTAAPILINVCSGKKYKYTAPALPSATSATATMAAVSGRLWSFTGLGTTGTISSGTVSSSDDESKIIEVTYPTNAAAASGDSVKLQYISVCGYSSAKAIKLTNVVTKLPSAPASITAASVLTNVCSGKIYRYTAPALPAATSATATVAAVTGRLWSFSGLGTTGTISSGDDGSAEGNGSTSIEVTYPTNDAAIAGDSVRLNYITACGITLAKSLKLTNKPATIPTPASIAASLVSDVCGARRYRYTAPTLATNLTAPSATGTVQAVNGYQWVLPSGSVGSTGTLADGFELSSNPIEIIYSSNDAAPSSGDSVKVSFTTASCGNGATKGLKLSNTKKTCASALPVTRVSPVVMPLESMSVKVFPNPTASNFNMQVITAGKEKISVKVIDVQGRVIKLLQVSANETMNIGADLKPGSYFLEVKQGNLSKTTRLLKL